MSKSSSKGSVTSISGDMVGGLIGFADDGPVGESFATGNVEGTGGGAGGLIGYI